LALFSISNVIPGGTVILGNDNPCLIMYQIYNNNNNNNNGSHMKFSIVNPNLGINNN
jgi:hypothetical protein